MQRALLSDFALKNPYYAGASVAVFEVNQNLQQTATLATLFATPVGATLRPNPIALDSEGKFPGPVYVQKPVVMVVTTATGGIETLGVSGIMPRWRGIWAAFALYYPGERVRDPAGPTTWIAVQGHVSNTFSGEVAQGFWQEEIDADSLTDALALDVLGTVIPAAPANAYLRVNPGENGIEARSAEQTRADIGAVSRAGDTMTGALVLPGQNPTLENQAARKGYVDTAVAALNAVNRAGDTMAGTLVLPGFDPVAPNDAARKGYVDTAVAALNAVNRAGDTMAGTLVLPGFDPVAPNDAARKGYVDTAVAALAVATNAAIAAINAAIAAAVPPGTIGAFAMSSAEPGWLFADGGAHSRTTYAALFAKIGTQHGAGDGVTTFNVPDYRGMFLRGFDAGRGLDPGRGFATFQDDEIESHGHTITDPGHFHQQLTDEVGSTASGGPFSVRNEAPSFWEGRNTGSAVTNIAINNTGGAETRPKNVAVYICIKT
jgi:microcystin-dependent protein